jgi:prephenate dehydrogenase
VTDVGSVKEGICAEARRLRLRNFVGGHPMAGSASSGFGSSSVELFRGRPWILVRGASKKALTEVRRLVRAAGGQPVVLADPRRHDRVLAFLSHLPQLLSWALRDAAASDPVAGRQLNLAGPGFRDMTRLASSPLPLWREILLENRAHVSRALQAFDRALRRRGSLA